jgi:hypothetical protein
MVIVVALAYLAGGIGLGIEPGSPDWWMSRPLWIAFLYLVLVPIAFVLAPLERRALPADAKVPSAPRLVGGAMLICLGVALLALFGIGSSPVPGLDIGAFAMVVVGSALSGLLPRFK